MHIRMRSVLDSRYVAEAYNNVANGVTAVGGNLLITSGDGVALSVEITPKGVDALFPTNGVLIHTNHVISPLLLNKVEDAFRGNGCNFVRYCRFNELLSGYKNIDKEYLFSVLRDHGGYPASLDTHITDDPRRKNRRQQTMHW